MSNAAVAIAHAGLFAAVEHAADGIVITDVTGAIQYVNPAFTTLTGYTPEEVVGSNPRVLKSGRHSPAFYEQLWSTLRSGRVWQGEITNRRKDGAFYDEEMRIAPVLDANGTNSGYIAIKHDITEQRARDEERAFLAAIVESSQDAIVAFTLAGTILTWNRGAEALFGYSAAETIGQSMSMLVPPERLSALSNLADNVSKDRADSHYEGLALCKNRRLVPVFVTASPVRNTAGSVAAIAVIIRDVLGALQS